MKQQANLKPLRIIKATVFKSYGREEKPVKLTYKQKQEEEHRKKNPALAAQIARRLKEEERQKEEQSACMQTVMGEASPLIIPDFIHFQELFNPIFRIDLNVMS